jgi:hypothetical protein
MGVGAKKPCAIAEQPFGKSATCAEAKASGFPWEPWKPPRPGEATPVLRISTKASLKMQELGGCDPLGQGVRSWKCVFSVGCGVSQ